MKSLIDKLIAAPAAGVADSDETRDLVYHIVKRSLMRVEQEAAGALPGAAPALPVASVDSEKED